MTKSSDGFTLIEVIVSFAILAITLSALYQGYGMSAQGMAAADARLKAIGLAQSKLAETGIVAPLKAGRTEGASDDGMRWAVEIEPRRAPERARPPLIAYDVRVEIRWGSRRSFRLSSIKLAPGQ